MKKTKLKLSQFYHILSHLGLDDHTYTHVSARCPSGDGYYIYAFGLCFNEVSPDNLLKIDFDGKVISGNEELYNPTGYIIHGEIYNSRPDINSIAHLHSKETIAVSIDMKGLRPISQHALHFYNKISYHNYGSLALSKDHGNSIKADLGRNYTMLMRNHGSLTCGKTIEESLFYTYHLQKACEVQCLIMSMNCEISEISNEICEKSVNDLLNFEENLGERDFKAWIRNLSLDNIF